MCNEPLTRETACWSANSIHDIPGLGHVYNGEAKNVFLSDRNHCRSFSVLYGFMVWRTVFIIQI